MARVIEAMQEYAAAKAREQRVICQKELDRAYTEDRENLNMAPVITEMFLLETLKECETPELD